MDPAERDEDGYQKSLPEREEDDPLHTEKLGSRAEGSQVDPIGTWVSGVRGEGLEGKTNEVAAQNMPRQ